MEVEISVDDIELDEMDEFSLSPLSCHSNKTSSYSWINKISIVDLTLSGTDMSQRIELSAANGPIFRTELRKRTDENGEEIPDQKQLSVLNHHDEKLLTVDYSKDRESFHLMEPDSNSFIAFFILLNNNSSGNRNTREEVKIHNVIDNEIYLVDLHSNPYRVQIRSESGEEMGIITKPPPKWTKILSGTMTLTFTGDERGGLTSREKVILLGFLVAQGIVGLDYWKTSTSGILTVYVLSILLFSSLVIWLYLRFQQPDNPSTKAKLKM